MGDAQREPKAVLSVGRREKEFEYLLKDLYFRLEERDRWYDQAIKYLLYGHGSAVALTIGLCGALMSREMSIGYIWIAIFPFFGGILLVGVAVYRCAKPAAKGRNQLRNMIDGYVAIGEPNYTEIFIRLPTIPSKFENFAKYCIYSALLFGIGACSLVGAIALHSGQAEGGIGQAAGAMPKIQ